MTKIYRMSKTGLEQLVFTFLVIIFKLYGSPIEFQDGLRSKIGNNTVIQLVL